MTETELYQKYIKGLLKSKGCFYQRIDYEGVPDIYTAKNGRVTWIELKCINKRVKEGTRIKPSWRLGQLSWIMSHRKSGGDSILLCLWYVDKFYILYPKEFYWEHELKIYEEELKYE
jgi:hypothetical protein